MLKTKCIKATIEADDGIRISVMSRHTLSDGVTPDLEITKEKYDFWLKQLSPPVNLVGAWYRGEICWAEYERNYQIFLNGKNDLLSGLSQIAQRTNVTLLCIESGPEKCHRRLRAAQNKA